ncbi:Auxin response factor 3 [Hordeum vulgare]|nr:Auxin response factor 3 [Hordeum vulgare]
MDEDTPTFDAATSLASLPTTGPVAAKGGKPRGGGARNASTKPRKKELTDEQRNKFRSAFQALEAFKAQHEGKSFNLTHCWTVINGEKKFKAQYGTLRAREGKEVVEEHGGGDRSRGERPTPRKRTSARRHHLSCKLLCKA